MVPPFVDGSAPQIRPQPAQRFHDRSCRNRGETSRVACSILRPFHLLPQARGLRSTLNRGCRLEDSTRRQLTTRAAGPEILTPTTRERLRASVTVGAQRPCTYVAARTRLSR